MVRLRGSLTPLKSLRPRCRRLLRRAVRDSGGRAPGGPNQGTERTEETQGTIPLAALPSFVVSCVLYVFFEHFRRPNRTEEPPRRDWSAAERRASPCIPQGDFEPFENVLLRQETIFDRSKVSPCNRRRYSTVRKCPPATGGDIRLFESVPLQQETIFNRSKVSPCNRRGLSKRSKMPSCDRRSQLNGSKSPISAILG